MDKKKTILYLSENDLIDLSISTQEVLESIEKLLVARSRSEAWSAPKAVIQPSDGRYMMAALAAADEPSLLAVKTVILNPRNPDQGLPQINGLVTLLDSRTGIPVGVMDGNWITEVRTAGLSAVAAKRMARPDASVAGFIGCGVQARSHLRAFATMFPLKEIRVFGRGQANIDSLCGLAKTLGLSATVFDTGRGAIEGADLIVSSVTYSAEMEPFLDATLLKPGSFSAITDLAAPWNRKTIGGFDRIVIDDMEQESALPNKLAPPKLIDGDISGLVLGSIEGRKGNNERTAFIFRGHAMGDLALAGLAYKKACDHSSGTIIRA